MPIPPPYHCTIFIPFHMADAAGILFFGNVFTLSHQAYEQFVINQLKCPWDEWFHNPKWIVPIKHAEANYLSPIFAGQECRFELSIDSIATTSFTLNTAHFQEKLCCTVKTTHVFCDPRTKQKIPIPPHLLPFIKS